MMSGATTPWLTVIGIGDDGLPGVAPAARALIDTAELLVGGERHQAMVEATAAQRLTWEGGLAAAMDRIATWRGRRVVVLATGDPMWFGGGANLAARFTAEEMLILPHPGAFSLAAARMLWPLADVTFVTVHGRALETLALAIQPDARLLVLSRDRHTPAAAAALLTDRGFGDSTITVLEHLGGPQERRFSATAARWTAEPGADLNTLAIECVAGRDAAVAPAVPGLPDTLFENDGQLTKREVRAATVSALLPLPGGLLWDLGAGSGAIAIEWLRCAPRQADRHGRRARAVAIERDPARAAAIARNAARLGVPDLQIITAAVPAALAALDAAPDRIFIGCSPGPAAGVAGEGDVLAAAWQALRPRGRLVCNGVTLETMMRLADFRAVHGGELTRIAVSRADPVGRLTAFRPLMEVTQYVVDKS